MFNCSKYVGFLLVLMVNNCFSSVVLSSANSITIGYKNPESLNSFDFDDTAISRSVFYRANTFEYELEFTFTSNSPIITSKTGMSIDCSIVEYFSKSSQYLFRRFKNLRAIAVELLEKMEHSPANQFEQISEKYDDVIAEINEVLRLVEKAFPESLTKLDRIATYTFDKNDHFLTEALHSNITLFDKVKVSKIRFGLNDWIKPPPTLKGFLNIHDDPKIMSDYNIVMTRELSPIESCLDDLKVSLVGSIEFSEKIEDQMGDLVNFEDMSMPIPMPNFLLNLPHENDPDLTNLDFGRPFPTCPGFTGDYRTRY